MNHARTLLLLISAACTWACIVPTLEEVEEKDEAHSRCDATHPCAEGWFCFDNQCFARTEVSCRPGETKACANQQGVCRNAREQCSVDFKGCTPATYAAHNSQYQFFETRCDDVDNDCDGAMDAWQPLSLNTASPSNELAAVAVRRGPVGRPDTVMTLTPEAGGLKVRTLSAEGLKEGVKFEAPAGNVTLRSPALASEGDLVAAAWIQQTLSSTPEYAVQLALMDGGGELKRNKVDILQTGSQQYISQVRLVMNRTHLLVLINITANFVEEFWVITIDRTLDLNTRSTPIVLGTSRVTSWFTAAAVRDQEDSFLVTYNQGGQRMLVGISNTGKELSPRRSMPQELSGATSLPFVVPANPSSALHTIFYMEDNLQGLDSLRYVKCDSELCEAPQTVLQNFDGRVKDMQLVTVPGALTPSLLVVKWSAPNPNDPNGPELEGHTVAPMLDDKPGTAGPLVLKAPRVQSEVFVLAPGPTGYVAYSEPPPSQGPTPPIARLQPFCLPR